MKLQMQSQQAPQQTRTGARTLLRTFLRGLFALGAFAAAALSGSAASPVEEIDDLTRDDILYHSSNDLGQQAYTRWYAGGPSSSSDGLRDFILWDNGKEYILGTYSGNSSSQLSISNDGRIFSNYLNSSIVGIDTGTFVWTPDVPNGTTSTGGFISLDSIVGSDDVPAYSSSIRIVTDYGLVIGHARTNYNNGSHAYVWAPEKGPQFIVSTSDWSGSTFGGVNSSGQVVGTMGTGNIGYDNRHAFLWTEDGGTKDLGLIADESVYSLTDVAGITESGLIVGNRGIYISREVYEYHAFIWKNEKDGIQDLLPGMKAHISGVYGDQVVGTIFDESHNPALNAFLNEHTNKGGYHLTWLVGEAGFIWTEEAGLRYVDELFADQLLTAQQLQEGTTSGWLAISPDGYYASDYAAYSDDGRLLGYGYWWDAENQNIIEGRYVLLTVPLAVPEPATCAALAGLALLAWAAMRRYRDAHD
ncbi:MAG: PEP-CTERM sorting domain-containing protein [Opitutaceae bacterium]|jgi:probable HAF family extracellular repeat protein|nr:PEP-CTERM sorting domain-containing protein [Opitutaceae bacterium]